MGIKGNTIVGRHIREENRLVTNNPLGHRPVKDIGQNEIPDEVRAEIQDLRWLYWVDRKNKDGNGNTS